MNSIGNRKQLNGRNGIAVLTLLAWTSGLLGCIFQMNAMREYRDGFVFPYILSLIEPLIDIVGCTLFLVYVSKFYMKRIKSALFAIALGIHAAGYLIQAIYYLTYIINGSRGIAIALFILNAASAVFYALAVYCFLKDFTKKIFIRIAFVLSFFPCTYYLYEIIDVIIKRTVFDFTDQSFIRAALFNIFTLFYTAALVIFYLINKDPSVKTLSSGKTDMEVDQIVTE